MISRRVLLPLLLVVLANFLAMMLVFPLLPFYAQIFDANPTQIGLLGSIFALCQLVAGPVLGKLSDRFGRKPILLVSQLGGLVGLLVMVFAGHLWVLFLARAIEGITAGNVAVAQAYIADSTEPHERSRAFGLLGATFGVSLLVGSAVSGLLAQYSLHYPIYLAIFFNAISVLGTLFVLPNRPPVSSLNEQESAEATSFSLRTDRSLRSLLVVFFLFVFIFAFFTQGIALFSQAFYINGEGNAYGAREIGFLFAYCGVIGILIQGGLMSRLVARFGESKLVRFGFVIDTFGYALLISARGLFGVLLGSTLFSIGNSVLRPAIMGLISQKASSRHQGQVLGVTTSLQSLGYVLAPPIGGYLIQHFEPSIWALSLSGLAALAFLMSRYQFSREFSS